MAKKPEARFSARIVKNLQGFYIDRIESRVGLGIPDMFLTCKTTGKILAIENKAVTRGLKVPLRPHQVSYLLSRAMVGAPVYVLVLHKKEGEAVGRVCLYSGADADVLTREGLRLKPLAEWPDNKIEWHRLGYILMSGNHSDMP